MHITTQVEIKSERIADLMVTAMECNHMTISWVAAVRLRAPTEASILANHQEPNWYNCAALWDGEFEIDVWEIGDESVYDGDLDPDDPSAPLPEGLAKYTITRKDMVEGFQLMAAKYPRHFADFLNENEDAYTADLFWQLVVLKDEVYA